MNPKLSYLICTSPRSGSTLLSIILGQSRLAGYPWEWFDANLYQNLFQKLGASTFSEYLPKVLEQGTTPNGVFGAKLMADHFYTLVDNLRQVQDSSAQNCFTQELLHSTFPNLHYIWLTRRDKVRQAVSFEKARQTGIWRAHDNSFNETERKLVFNHEAIDRWIKYIIDQEFAWQEYFAEANITPFTLVYEDFYQFPEETVRHVLDYLHIPVPANWELGEIKESKLADEISEQWVQKYRQHMSVQLQKQENIPATLQILKPETLVSLEAPPSIRLIAFYLPQYHPIPENNEWWGLGFTEWTNVTKAQPLFDGHYQPHLPADLGYYDLRLPETRQAQADLAKAHGIYGFCYYHYWFNGKQLLERPFSEVLASGQPDFPFCLCWANENWTRAWDGLDRHVLIEQKYGPEDDRQHIRWLASAFRDKRYIRIDDKPLFLVYRISKFPNPLRTANIWREEAQKMGLGDLYLCTVESLLDDRVDPTRIGFDAAVEFQPDWLNLGSPLQQTDQNNRIYDYPSLVERMLQRTEIAYKRFPCVTPGWDNTARRIKDAIIFKDSTPEQYQAWLEAVIKKFKPASPSENLVFINAWNEWAEGAHLEPCQKWGRAYLVATQKALQNSQTQLRQSNANTSTSKEVKSTNIKISVCIPTYNGAKYVGEAITSVLAQTLPDFELVIVDDCSTDQTETVVKSFDDKRIKFFKNPVRLGLVGNWNKCIELARGEYICIFHQDDIMLPENLMEKMTLLDANPTVGLVHSSVFQIDAAGNVISDWWYFKPEPGEHGVHQGVAYFKKLLLGVNIIACPSVLVRRECYEKLGYFDPRLPFTADWEMWLRITLFYDVAYLTQALIKYRRHPGNETLNFSGVRELEQAFQAKILILDKYPQLVSTTTDLKLQITREYQKQAIERAFHHYSQQQYQEAKPYLALAVELQAMTIKSTSPGEYIDWFLEIIEQFWQKLASPAQQKFNSGTLPQPSFELSPAQQQIVHNMSGEYMARQIPIRKIIQAVFFKLGNKPGFGWLYRFRGLGRKVIGGR